MQIEILVPLDDLQPLLAAVDGDMIYLRGTSGRVRLDSGRLLHWLLIGDRLVLRIGLHTKVFDLVENGSTIQRLVIALLTKENFFERSKEKEQMRTYQFLEPQSPVTPPDNGFERGLG